MPLRRKTKPEQSLSIPLCCGIPTIFGRDASMDAIPAEGLKRVSHSELIDLLNEDLAREYRAIVAYVVYSQFLNGAEFMHVAGELEKHVAQELNHALILGEQIDCLASIPLHEAGAPSASKKAMEMLQVQHDSEAETVRNYSERILQCEDLAEYAVCEQIRGIMVGKQIHRIALAAALTKNASNRPQAV
jgi:bacterioferritin